MLFDLSKDPSERFDIADAHPRIVASLEKAYADWNKENIPPKWIDPHAENVIKEENNFRKIRAKAQK